MKIASAVLAAALLASPAFAAEAPVTGAKPAAAATSPANSPANSPAKTAPAGVDKAGKVGMDLPPTETAGRKGVTATSAGSVSPAAAKGAAVGMERSLGEERPAPAKASK